MNWPDITVAACAVLTILITLIGGVFRILGEIQTVKEILKANNEKHDTHEKRIDDHETRIRALEKIRT